MSLLRQEIRQMAGEVMICGFEGQDVNAETKEILRELGPLGLIVFARNVAGVEALQDLVGALKRHEVRGARSDRLLSIDQEGGRVARVREGVTVWPPMAALGRLDDSALAQAVGGALGAEMRALGFDLNFAPVLDVHTNVNNPVIGDRALADTPAKAARLGAALVRGQQAAGVAACGKHFPGHGDTDADSHLTLPELAHDLGRLEAIEWPPFAAAIEAGVASIMTAHVAVPALGEGPATLVERIVRHMLRQKLGFRGVVIGDDIDMRGLCDHVEPHRMGPLGLLAGVDVFLACKDPAAMFALYRGIVQGVESGEVPGEVLRQAALRARALRQRYWRPPLPAQQAMATLRALVDQHRPLASQLASA